MVLAQFYRFALKSFVEKEVFDRENKRFESASINNPDMVSYLGSCTEEPPPDLQSENPGKAAAMELSSDTKRLYHIILEFCDRDLGDCIERTNPPLLVEDIATFWFQLFPIVTALERLHTFEEAGQVWYGLVL